MPFRWFLASVALASFVACSAQTPPAQAPAKPAARVVALVPSLVEDLFAIGAGPQVVGVSAFTENVPQAAFLPRVADFSSVDAEKIVALRPDLVVGIPSQERLIEPLRRAGIPVVLMPNDSYDDIFLDLTNVGRLTGHEERARALAAELLRETARLQAKARAFAVRPSVFVVLGTAPIWTVGRKSYIATLIAMAGGRNAADDLPAPYGVYSAEALLRDQPDAVIDDPAVHLDGVLGREPWHSLRAVARGHVYAIEPPEMLMRPGPFYNTGLAWLVERLTPLAKR